MNDFDFFGMDDMDENDSVAATQDINQPQRVQQERYEIYDIFYESVDETIFKARDTRLNGREVFVKRKKYDAYPELFNIQNDDSRKEKIERIRSRLYFEAHILGELSKVETMCLPKIVDVYFGFSPSIYGPHRDINGNEYYIKDQYVNDEPYFVMESYDGESMWDMVKGGIKNLCRRYEYKYYHMWEWKVLNCGVEVASALQELHYNNYVFKNLNPACIIMSNSSAGTYTLNDLSGITKIDNDDELADGILNDIHSFGITMYQLLTGFETMTSVEYSLSGVCTNSTLNLLLNCLAPKDEMRYSSMSQIISDILNCVDDAENCVINMYYK